MEQGPDPRETGIGGLDVRNIGGNLTGAEGGIVAFAEGDPVESKPPTIKPDREAFNYYISQGWTPAAAAGFVSNIQAESAFNPNAQHDFDNKTKTYIGTGLVGWNAGRRQQLEAMYGPKPTYQQQLEYLHKELSGETQGEPGTAGVGKRLRDNPNTSAKDAGAMLSREGIRPRDREGQAKYRGNLAEQLLTGFSGSGNANAAEVPGTKAAEPFAPAKTNTTNILGENSDAIIGGVGTGAVAAGAAVNAANTKLAAKHAAQNPLPPRPVVTQVPGPVQPGSSPLAIKTLPNVPAAPPTVGGIVAKNTPDWLKPKATPLGGTSLLGKAASAAGRYFAPAGAAVAAGTASQEDINAYFGRPNDSENGPISDAAHRVLYGAAQVPNVFTFGLTDYLLGRSGLGNRGKFDEAGNRRPPTDPAAAANLAAPKPVVPAAKSPVDDASRADRGRSSYDREANDKKHAPEVSAYDEIRSLIKKLPPPESEDDAEERYQKTAEKFGVSTENIKKHFTDQANSLTKQANQARQDRDVNLWMSAANAFFAVAGGMSPYAVKNFADGLGVGTKQMIQTLGEYNKEQREIDKANRELAKLNISSSMQMSKEYLDRREKARDKATTHQEKQIGLLTNLSRIVMEDRRTDVLAGGRDADRLQKEQVARDQAVRNLRNSDEYKNMTTTIERLISKKDRTPADTSNLTRLQLRKQQMIDAALGDSSSQSGGAGVRPDPAKIGQFDK